MEANADPTASIQRGTGILHFIKTELSSNRTIEYTDEIGDFDASTLRWTHHLRIPYLDCRVVFTLFICSTLEFIANSTFPACELMFHASGDKTSSKTSALQAILFVSVFKFTHGLVVRVLAAALLCFEVIRTIIAVLIDERVL
jgi:hypothetical protein